MEDAEIIIEEKTSLQCTLNGFFNPLPPAGEVADKLNDADGDGYLDIWYLEQLQYIDKNATTRNYNYELMRSLDFQDDNSYLNPEQNKELWTTGEGWKPIGRIYDNGSYIMTEQFMGNFEGNNFTISNLYINRPGSSQIVLFSMIYGNFKNLKLKNVYITRKTRTGSLAGASGSYSKTDNIIENCIVENAVIIGNGGYIGGLLGESYSQVQKSAVINVNVTGNGPFIGGFIGDNQRTITECYATGRVENIYNVSTENTMSGGFAGRNGKTIKNSYADVTIVNSSSTASVHIGGFVGYNYMSTVENCYSIGQVIQNSSGSTNGLIGWASSDTVINSYWDKEKSGISTTGRGVGLTTSQMKQQASYQGWNFENVWGIDPNINNGYPYLRIFVK